MSLSLRQIKELGYVPCYDDILLVPRYSELDSRKTPNISNFIGPLKIHIPIISSPMDSITGKHMVVTMDRLGGLGILTRYIGMQDDEELSLQMAEVAWARNNGAKNIGCAIGVKGDTQTKAASLISAGCNVICVDVAHGDHVKVYRAVDALVELKKNVHFVIMAGNVCTGDAAYRLARAGVDAIKVGIGPGAACTTRSVTGYGMPQLGAIFDVYDSIHNLFPNVSIIADGGIRTSGDMVKALWCGADACMIGYMLAGTNSAPTINGKKTYRGMSSQAVSGRRDIAQEGVEINIRPIGTTEDVVLNCANGIKSGLAMGGVIDIAQLRTSVRFVTVSSLSIKESLPYGDNKN